MYFLFVLSIQEIYIVESKMYVYYRIMVKHRFKETKATDLIILGQVRKYAVQMKIYGCVGWYTCMDYL